MATQELEIQAKVKALLAEQRRSIRWLSDESGITYQTLNRRLDHPEQFTIRELLKVGDVLGVRLWVDIDVDHDKKVAA